MKPDWQQACPRLQRCWEHAREFLERYPVSGEEEARRLHYTIFLLVAIPTMVGYGLYNWWLGHYRLCALVVLSATGLTAGWSLLRRPGFSRPVYRTNVVLFSALLLYMVITGGEGGSKILWMYTFPLISFFLLGEKEGFLWNLGMFLVAGTLFVVPGAGSVIHPYPPAFQVRFLTTYAIVSTVTYLFERFRQNYRTNLETANASLRREIAERQQAESEREKLIGQLQSALQEVKTLSGFLPICSCCKKIRDDRGYWNQLESYLRDHSSVQFSHSICPECTHKLYPDLSGPNIPSREDRTPP